MQDVSSIINLFITCISLQYQGHCSTLSFYCVLIIDVCMSVPKEQCCRCLDLCLCFVNLCLCHGQNHMCSYGSAFLDRSGFFSRSLFTRGDSGWVLVVTWWVTCLCVLVNCVLTPKVISVAEQK